MPPTRRFKVLAIALTIIICTIFYLSGDSSSQEFYSRTVTALDKKASDREAAHGFQGVQSPADAQEPIGGPPSRDSTRNVPHQESGDRQTPSSRDSLISNPKAEASGEKSVAGRKTMKGGEDKDVGSSKKYPKESSNAVGKDKTQAEDETSGSSGKAAAAESEEDHEIETELNSILKKGPIIIFSKSYCPYSAKAKKILLEKYTIVPAPYVVELDTHPLGSGLQNALEKSTGRRTVPNVLVSGRSIGGGDDIQALDDSGGLTDKLKGMAGKRIMEARLTEEK